MVNIVDLSKVDVHRMSPSEKRKLIKYLERRKERAETGGHLYKLFPDEGPFAWYKYEKHIEFFNAGKIFRERCFMAGNRTGKSQAGGYEMASHLTGIYPHWWEGRVFDQAIDAWAAGDTGQTTRDIIQYILLGPPGEMGTGLIPKDTILDYKVRPGIPNAIDSVEVRHVSGDVSRLGFKSYDQKRRSFQGTAKEVIWLDEEPPDEVYGESIMRTMTTNGMIYVTFTPLQGLTEFVMDFMENSVSGTEEDYEDEEELIVHG